MQLNDEFVEKLRSRIGDECTVEWHNYHNIRVEFSSGDLKVYLNQENKLLSDFDFVYFKGFFRNSEIAGVIATYLDQTKTPFVCSELLNHIALTKLGQLTRLSVNNLPIAETIFLQNDTFARSYLQIAEKLSVPFIFKAIDGSGGDENFLIHSEEQFIGALKKFPDLLFIAQKFIDNDSDLRVLVVGSKIELVIKRQRQDKDTHLNNTSQGAKATLVALEDLASEHQELSLKAAKIMGREIAGVDLLFESGTGKPFILEVNASPQIASGAFTKEKLDIYSNYFKNMVK